MDRLCGSHQCYQFLGMSWILARAQYRSVIEIIHIDKAQPRMETIGECKMAVRSVCLSCATSKVFLRRTRGVRSTSLCARNSKQILFTASFISISRVIYNMSASRSPIASLSTRSLLLSLFLLSVSLLGLFACAD
jgi:hypothetical protein